jgi:hypothetical protein
VMLPTCAVPFGHGRSEAELRSLREWRRTAYPSERRAEHWGNPVKPRSRVTVLLCLASLLLTMGVASPTYAKVVNAKIVSHSPKGSAKRSGTTTMRAHADGPDISEVGPTRAYRLSNRKTKFYWDSTTPLADGRIKRVAQHLVQAQADLLSVQLGVAEELAWPQVPLHHADHERARLLLRRSCPVGDETSHRRSRRFCWHTGIWSHPISSTSTWCRARRRPAPSTHGGGRCSG